MTNFKVGQRVVCVRPGKATNIFGLIQEVFKGHIYTITEKGFIPESEDYHASYYFKFEEIKGTWKQDRFEPLQYESATSEILAKFTLTEEKADVKIKELETANCIRDRGENPFSPLKKIAEDSSVRSKR